MKLTSYITVFVLCLIVFVSFWEESSAQALRKRRKDRPQRNRQSGGGGDGQSDDPKLFKALQVLYPLKFFDPNALNDPNFNWRKPAVYDETLAENSEKEKDYLHLSKAQDQEDVWLYENWFYGMRNGIILESGALDGHLFSNSFMFETFANWTAIHVEADPVNYGRLRTNRENAININGALCSEAKLLHYSSLGVLPVRGFIEFMSPSFIKKWHGKIYNNKTSIDELPTVQCLPMKLLLRELNIQHIDIWILDVEGAEESVLKGTDFNTVHINSVAMECDEHDISKNERKTSILEANNFECKLVERNCMCRNKDYKPSSAKYRSTLKKFDGQKWSKTYVTKEV